MQQVAIAILENDRGQFWLQYRESSVKLPDVWSFAGGKAEPNEKVHEALIRECREECGIEVLTYYPIMQRINHQAEIELFFYKVTSYEGEVIAAEGQKGQWFDLQELSSLKLPPMNRDSLRLMKLPSNIAISDEWFDYEDFADRAKQAEILGADYLIIRTSYPEIAWKAQRKAEKNCQFPMSINTERGLGLENPQMGYHFKSSQMQEAFDYINQLNIEVNKPAKEPWNLRNWVGLSCHDANDIEKANDSEVDYIFISPVATPKTEHDEVFPTLGWQEFERLVALSDKPVYALGGMTADDLLRAYSAGAAGIASISAYWKDPEAL